MMKRIAISLVCPLIGLLFMTSCLDDKNEIEKSSEVALLSFGIKDLKTVHTIKTATGKDSTYTTVMSGGAVWFTIDQAQRLVYNRDSIAYGTDVRRVLVKVTADGYVYYRKKNGELGSVEDSIDFTSPVTFQVKSYDEQYTRDYLVSINVHKVNPKKTTWIPIEDTDFPEFIEQKAFIKGDSLLVIGKNADGLIYKASTATADGKEWITSECKGITGTADCHSAQLIGDVFYMTADGILHQSADAVIWTSVNNSIPVSTLLAVENGYTPTLWGISGSDFVSSTNMSTWAAKQQWKEPITHSVASISQPLRTNEKITRTIFVAIPQAADTCAQVWTKLSTDSTWTEIEPNENNSYGCPNLENLAIIPYAERMYAFGGKSVGKREKPIEAFNNCYESRDNGVTWKVNENALSLPEAFRGRTDTFSTATDGEYVWVMWSNGQVWRGRWNGLE